MNYENLTLKLFNNKIKIKAYVAAIEAANKYINLTGFSGDRLWQEGIYESIVALNDQIESGSLLDIGAGAGFPSVPLAIFNHKLNITILEPQQKRFDFLCKINTELKLELDIIRSRAETFTTQTFDFITARAVAPLYKLIEISHHLGHIGSTFIFIKSKNYHHEIDQAAAIIKKLKIELEIKKMVVGTKEIVIIKYQKKYVTPPGIPRPWHKI